MLVRVLVVSALFFSISVGAAEPKNPLVGAWRLLSYKINHANGTTSDYFVKPVGQIIYSSNGRMSVHLLDLEPPRCEPGAGRDCDSPLERSRSFGYAGYWGRYELAPDQKTVRHFVENFAPRPGVTQRQPSTTLTRTVKLDGDRVTLTTPPQRRGDEQVTLTLVWERIK